MKKASLKEIARQVGVSTASVSYVLNKRNESKVSDSVAKKIRKVAKDLNYRPNQIAKSLKLGKTFTIGLIFADISNPFYANIARVIEDEAKKLGYTVIFGSSDENVDKSEKLIDVFIKRQVDGLIISPVDGSQNQIEKLKSMDIPLVLFDRYFPEIETSYVVIDNYQASYNATQLLIRSGCKKIGMICYDNKLIHMEDRIKGYHDAIARKGMFGSHKMIKQVKHPSLKKDVRQALEQLISENKNLDGLVLATNKIAIETLKYLKEINIRVPDDLALVTFDQGDFLDLYYCPVTHVKQPISHIGKSSIHQLVEQMKNKKIVKKETVLKSELIIRESSSKLN